jgi:hypothetical protein
MLAARISDSDERRANTPAAVSTVIKTSTTIMM